MGRPIPPSNQCRLPLHILLPLRWGTFCNHLSGEWVGQYGAYTPWEGLAEPVWLDAGNKWVAGRGRGGGGQYRLGRAVHAGHFNHRICIRYWCRHCGYMIGCTASLQLHLLGWVYCLPAGTLTGCTAARWSTGVLTRMVTTVLSARLAGQHQLKASGNSRRGCVGGTKAVTMQGLVHQVSPNTSPPPPSDLPGHSGSPPRVSWSKLMPTSMSRPSPLTGVTCS